MGDSWRYHMMLIWSGPAEAIGLCRGMLLKTLLRRSNPLAYAQMEGEGEAGTHPGQEPATEASLTPTVLGARCDEPKPPTLPDGI